MNKHTPGTWYFETDGDGPQAQHHDRYIVASNGGGRICTMHLPNSGGKSEIDANARLIAAAPEMLAILDSLRVWFIAPDLKAETLEGYARLIQNTVKKAKGESNG